MQDYVNPKSLSLKSILFFILILFIAFLPISSFLFFLKDDTFTGYFPPKFFMSESLHSGYLPLWNPYINFGIPQYGDMSSGFWSPITWLIAFLAGYNAYTLTIEVLFYILLGGLGMYTLTQFWKLDKRVCTIAGIAFMCCGYNIGHLQHFNWLSGAAFLPWCLWSYLLLLNQCTAKNILRTGFFLYMLIASAHPGISISTAYFFIAVLLFSFFFNENKQPLIIRIKKIISSQLLLLLLLTLLSAGMIAGYLDILPHFVRGEKISLVSSLEQPTTFQSWISLVLPFSVVKNDSWYNNDITMRNCYFSITLLLFFLVAVLSKKNAWQKFLLIAGLFFALLSSGGIFKTFAYYCIPLTSYVRENGEFRIFSLLCFILMAAIGLDRFIRQKNNFEKKIKNIYFFLEVVIFTFIFWGLYEAIHTKESFLYETKNAFLHQGIATKLKAFIDAISFYDTCWTQGVVQLFLLWGIKWCLKFKNWNLLKEIVTADLIIATLLNIPFTGVGKTSVAHVQEVLNKSPNGIIIPPLHPIIVNDTSNTEEKVMIGDWSMYNKQIGVINEVPYPIILKNTDQYFSYASPNTISKPFLFTKEGTDSIHIIAFSPGKLTLQINASTNDSIIYQQNFYPHWFYQNNTEKKEVNKSGINFMSAPIVRGSNTVCFNFEPVLVKRFMLISAISFAICGLLLLILRTKPPSPS